MKKSLTLAGYVVALSLSLFLSARAEASNLASVRTAITCGTDDDGPSLYTVGFVATGLSREYTAYIVNNTYAAAKLIAVVKNVTAASDPSGNAVFSDAQKQLKAILYKQRNFNAGHFVFTWNYGAISRGFQTCTRNTTISFDKN